MKHDIIKTDDYLLVVDESEITKGDWHLANDVMITKSHLIDENCKKIIAHLPLNGSPILEGVDLLPSLEEDEVEKSANLDSKNYYKDQSDYWAIGLDSFKRGYSKAKEKFKYTEEDIKNAIIRAYYLMGDKIDVGYFDKIIQSLQPKTPTGFECETERLFKHNEFMEREFYDSILTTTTPEGHTQWEGTYIFN